MRVLIVGAAGPLGQAFVREALKQGHSVTALVRNREQLADLNQPKFKVMQGDVLDPGALDRPLLEQDAVICTLGMKPTRKPVTLFSEGTGNLIRAMQRHNVRKLLCITGIGAGASRGHGGFFYDRVTQPLLLKTIYEDKTRQEKLLQACDRDWMIIRPARLTLERQRQRFSVVQNTRGLTAGKIPRADVAVWTIRQLDNGKYLYRAVVLTE